MGGGILAILCLSDSNNEGEDSYLSNYLLEFMVMSLFIGSIILRFVTAMVSLVTF